MNNKKILLIVFSILVIGNFLFILNYFKPSIIGNVISEDNGDFEGIQFVSRVIDGDTVVINGESVRLLGIDTDERGGECYKEAKIRLEELVLNKEVKLEKGKRDKDQYKRYLRYLFIEGENVNLKMVEEGLAIARFYEDKKYKGEILDAEKKARGDKVGCKWVSI